MEEKWKEMVHAKDSYVTRRFLERVRGGEMGSQLVEEEISWVIFPTKMTENFIAVNYKLLFSLYSGIADHPNSWVASVRRLRQATVVTKTSPDKVDVASQNFFPSKSEPKGIHGK